MDPLQFELDFYEDEHGDQPVLRWGREELTRTQRFALGQAMREVLQEKGVGVCATEYGKQLGKVPFEFRLRRSAGAAEEARVLLRVFCHALRKQGRPVARGLRQGRRSVSAPAERGDRGRQAPPRRLAAPAALIPDVAKHILVPSATDRGAPMSRDFDELMDEIEQEARRGGPKATAEYAAFGAYHRLAREIFDLRKAAGLTQRQLAAKSGVQQADISRIEAGDANPTLATIAALAYALGAELSLEAKKARRPAAKRTTAKRRAPVLVAARRRP